MDFDKSKVYTALNADELKVGSKVAFADSLSDLKQDVRDETFDILEAIRGEDKSERFVIEGGLAFALAYLVSEPEKTWIVYLCRRNPDNYYLTACRSDAWEIVQKEYDAKTKLFEGTEEDCDNWYTSRRHFANVIAAWEDGKTIQYDSGYGWGDCCDNKPVWDVTSEYRIKPEGLKWTDLKIGDILHKIDNDTDVNAMVIAIDKNPATSFHVMVGNGWISDERLAVDWSKVE